MKNRRRFRLRLPMAGRQALKGYMFILPWLLGFLFFYAYSLFLTARYSVSTVDLVQGKVEFLGVDHWYDHYLYAFQGHGTFPQVLVRSLGNMVIDVPLIIFFSLFVAMLLNGKFKGRGLVRAIFFLPIIMNADAVVDAMEMAARMMSGGLSSVSSEMASSITGGGVSVNYYIQLFGDLAIPDVILEYIVGAVDRISQIIQASGVQIILFIAALQSIPGSLYEVARIEGATGYETFWKVTFPMVMPHIITNTIYTIVDNYTGSEVVQLAYDTAFSTAQRADISSAFSLISMVITCLILGLVVFLLNKRAFYYN